MADEQRDGYDRDLFDDHDRDRLLQDSLGAGYVATSTTRGSAARGGRLSPR